MRTGELELELCNLMLLNTLKLRALCCQKSRLSIAKLLNLNSSELKKQFFLIKSLAWPPSVCSVLLFFVTKFIFSHIFGILRSLPVHMLYYCRPGSLISIYLVFVYLKNKFHQLLCQHSIKGVIQPKQLCLQNPLIRFYIGKFS